MPLAPEHRCHLVHHAARDPGRAVLDLLRDEREGARFDREVGDSRSRECDRDFERGARREARTDGDRRGDNGVEAALDAATRGEQRLGRGDGPQPRRFARALGDDAIVERFDRDGGVRRGANPMTMSRSIAIGRQRPSW